MYILSLDIVEELPGVDIIIDPEAPQYADGRFTVLYNKKQIVLRDSDAKKILEFLWAISFKDIHYHHGIFPNIRFVNGFDENCKKCMEDKEAITRAIYRYLDSIVEGVKLETEDSIKEYANKPLSPHLKMFRNFFNFNTEVTIMIKNEENSIIEKRKGLKLLNMLFPDTYH